MKRILIAAAMFTLLWPVALLAQGRYETMVIEGPAQTTNKLEVAANEICELVSFDRDDQGSPAIFVSKGQARASAHQNSYLSNGDLSKGNLIVKGPATIEVVAYNGRAGIFSFRLWPERADPNTTQFITPQDGNVGVAMECSTDLLTWSPATNGVYAVASGAKFFRLRLDRGN